MKTIAATLDMMGIIWVFWGWGGFFWVGGLFCWGFYCGVFGEVLGLVFWGCFALVCFGFLFVFWGNFSPAQQWKYWGGVFLKELMALDLFYKNHTEIHWGNECCYNYTYINSTCFWHSQMEMGQTSPFRTYICSSIIRMNKFMCISGLFLQSATMFYNFRLIIYST